MGASLLPPNHGIESRSGVKPTLSGCLRGSQTNRHTPTTGGIESRSATTIGPASACPAGGGKVRVPSGGRRNRQHGQRGVSYSGRLDDAGVHLRHHGERRESSAGHHVGVRATVLIFVFVEYGCSLPSSTPPAGLRIPIQGFRGVRDSGTGDRIHRSAHPRFAAWRGSPREILVACPKSQYSVLRVLFSPIHIVNGAMVSECRNYPRSN
jgi:hypothetical protein